MKKYNIWLIAAALGLAPHAAMAEGLDFGNVLGAIVNGAAKAIDENQRRQNNRSGSPKVAPAPVGQASGGGALATDTECGNINNWAASSYHPSRTEQLFGKPIHQWGDADYSQVSARVSACRGAVDGNWRGRTDNTLRYLSEAKRSWDAYRAESTKLNDETKKLATVMPPEGAEQFFDRLSEINKAAPYGGVIVSSYDIRPKLPNRNDLAWKIDTRPYDQAAKDLEKRFVAKMPKHLPFMMSQLRPLFVKKAQEVPDMSAKVKGVKGQDLTWSIPQEIFVSGMMSGFCAEDAAKLGFRGEQMAVFKQGCEQYVANPSPEVVDAFKRDMSAIPASIDDMVVLGRLCDAIDSSSGVLKRACSDQVAELRQNLSGEDQILAKAWLGEPLSCEEAIEASDMDQDDLKNTYLFTMKGLFENTQVSFFDQVCSAAPQGVQLTFTGQGMFSGPDEILIQTNERIMRGLSPVRITLASIDGPSGEDLYYGSHIKAEVWDAMNKAVRVVDRPLKTTSMMQWASMPSEWLDILNCSSAARKRRMGPNSCEKMAGILLYPSVR